MKRLTYSEMKEDDFKLINTELSKKDTIDVIKWAYKLFGDDIIYACSFGAEGIVLIDLISKIRPMAKVVFLDTHFHFNETYELIERVRLKYPQLTIEILEPSLTVEEQANQYGNELWKHKPDQCCYLRKIIPLQTKLSEVTAWISGLRREQSPSRATTNYVNPDHRFKSIKICPLIHWTWDDIWTYIGTFQLPYNPLHDQNYPSIGCTHCTATVVVGEDLRSGRWKDHKKTECGLHSVMDPNKKETTTD